MPLNNLLAERQAYACPIILLSRVQPLEDREDLVGVLHVHADAVILYGKPPRVSSSVEHRVNLHFGRPLTSKLNRVSDEVLEMAIRYKNTLLLHRQAISEE